jgi:Na+-translocating ferredoxin:NAD+ oxidoreductase RnfG subunit
MASPPPNRLLPLAFLLGALAAPCGAATYLTQDQALALAFEHPATAKRHPLLFDDATRRAIEKAMGARVEQRGVLAFSGKLKGGGHGAVLLDAVLGKHEAIDYMVVLEQSAKVRFVEVLAYRESYGGEIRNKAWREQFAGKSDKDPPEHAKSILNISGATLSCRHVTEGVRKLLAVATLRAGELGLDPLP